MSTFDMDYLLDDLTSNITETVFSDIHDRRFLRVRKTLVRADHFVVQVFDFGRVSPMAFAGADYHQLSRAVLVMPSTPGSTTALTVKYDDWTAPMPIEQYLRRPLLSRSSSRTVTMSDGQDYKWSRRGAVRESEWTCTTAMGYLVAHYDLKSIDQPEYSSSSGNALTICHSFTHLTIEILTSLILMRHITQ